MAVPRVVSTQLKSITSILFVLVFFVFTLVNLSFDYIHEGVNIASTLGIKNGQVIHRDIYEMKGLLFPYFMSFFSSDYTFSIINFKIINILLISANSTTSTRV